MQTSHWIVLGVSAVLILQGLDSPKSLASETDSPANNSQDQVASTEPLYSLVGPSGLVVQLDETAKKTANSLPNLPKVKQAVVAQSEDSSPLRFSVPPTTNPSPAESTTELVTPQVPIADPAKPYTPPPDYLNPIANPLQFPTKPEEVKIQGTQPITLQQALELARRHNRTLQVTQLQLENSRLVLQEAEAALYPSVNLNGNLSYDDSAQGELSNIRQQSSQSDLSRLLGNSNNQSTTSTTFNSSVEVTYSLDISGSRAASIRAAERQVRLNELEHERVLEGLRLDVTNDYYALQQADEQVRISQKAVENAQASLKDARALERAGVGTKFDVLRSEVQLANANQDLVRSRSQQKIARRQLVQRLSLSQAVDVSAADPIAIAGLWNLSLEDSIVQAFKNRPELEQQLVQREIGANQREIALAAVRPQVNLFANYSLLDVLSDSFGITDGYSIGARLQWNLYDGGAANARAGQRDKDIEIAETRFADTRNQIRFQVEQSYANLQANFENIQTAATALTQAEESLRLARLRFQAGVGTQTDVINAETELTRAEVNRLQAILDYNRSLAALQRSISNLQTTSSLN